ncbi:MAG: hypothetical protein JWM27_3231 [Gemmatimonadetes bacterium]|nr:hypothetical protein [Gemmatimonadota bacterium]
MRRTLLAAIVLLAAAAPLRAQEPQVSPTAPVDRPVAGRDTTEFNQIQRMIAPAVRQARASWPQARRRYLAGLPAGRIFFVTTLLTDGRGSREQVFVRVDAIAGDIVRGRIWSDIAAVRGYAKGQAVTLRDADVLDWLIAHPDGTEEGNFVGKLIDRMQAAGHP